MNTGAVAIVATGAKAPDLLTRRAERRLSACDVVFVAPGVSLALQTSIAGPAMVPCPGAGAARALAEAARAGKQVGWLVQGAPGKVETELACQLEREGVPFEVIPGVAENACVQACPGLPLGGVTVVSTRMSHQDPPLREALESLGASVISFPLFHIAGSSDSGRREDALRSLPGCDWAVVTSANAAQALFGCLADLGMDVRSLSGVRLVAVGVATERALSRRGLSADLMPPEARSEGIVAALSERAKPGERVVLLRAEGGRRALSDGLQACGLVVTEASLYRTLPVESPYQEPLRQALVEGRVHYLILTSAKAARRALALFSAPVLAHARIVALGPVTAQGAAEAGLKVGPVARDAEMDAVVEALVDDWRKRHVSGS